VVTRGHSCLPLDPIHSHSSVRNSHTALSTPHSRNIFHTFWCYLIARSSFVSLTARFSLQQRESKLFLWSEGWWDLARSLIGSSVASLFTPADKGLNDGRFLDPRGAPEKTVRPAASIERAIGFCKISHLIRKSQYKSSDSYVDTTIRLLHSPECSCLPDVSGLISQNSKTLPK